MRILVNDHAGHPFPVQLGRSLASRSHQVLHTYTAGLQTPRGALQSQESDPATFTISPIALTKSFNRYGLVRRFMQERELGRILTARMNAFGPDVVISANMPLGAQAILVNDCRSNRTGFVFWLQDLLGVGIRNNLKKKIPFLGSLIGKYYMGLEGRLLKESQAVVVITGDFVPICQEAGVLENNVHVIHNWAPLDEVPTMSKNNAWSREHGLEQTFNFVYSGTLGMKHNPGILIELARAFKQQTQVQVVVVSEGLGAEFLCEQKRKLGLNNLVLFPFQPFNQIPQVQSTADVLIAILEPDAGVFSVPSKVLTYLCAKRPLLLAVPLENLAARIVHENNAGIVVAPDDIDGFVKAAERLLHDQTLRDEMAENGRNYTETHFKIEKITDNFEQIITNIHP